MKGSKFFVYVSQCLLLFFMFVLTPTLSGLASTDSLLASPKHAEKEELGAEWNKLNDFAAQAVEAFKKEDFTRARDAVIQIENHLLDLELGDYVDRLDQANMITETVVQAKYALNQVQPDKKAVERKILQMRLALEAVSHKQQPLWLNLYPPVSNVIQDIRNTIEQNNRDLFYQKINQLTALYQLVRPALFVSHKQGVVEQLDSQVAFFTKNTADRWKNKDQTMNVLQTFENQIKLAFFQKTNQSMQSFIFLLIGFTSIICAVLAYVGWRKYKGENEQKTVSWKHISSKNID